MKTTILVLASNPQGTVKLELEREIHAIEDALERGKKREYFVLRSNLLKKSGDSHKNSDQ